MFCQDTVKKLFFLAFIIGYGSSQNGSNSGSSSSQTITNCGVVIRPDPEPLKETLLRIGDWPWLATIYQEEFWNLKKFCVGTLVSSKAILTTANCVFKGRSPLTPNQIVVRLGQTNLTNWNERTVISPAIKNIVVHPNFRPFEERGVAIIVLQDDVVFTDFIKPACLWTSGYSSNENEFGFVARWNSHIAHRTSARIVSNETCDCSIAELDRDYISETTFCAGDKNGYGPCTADSGTGLLLKQNGRWTVRGILTRGFGSSGTKCDLNRYLVYVDVAKVSDWIQANLPKSHTDNDLLESATEICGKSDFVDPEPLKETPITAGEWPWMATLYRPNTESLGFLCMGILVSSRTVLAAAHCIQNTHKNSEGSELLVRLGQRHRSDWSSSAVITSSVKYYEVHPYYSIDRSSRPQSGDIAILVFPDKIRFTEYIRPACLWSGDINFNEGEFGFVATWGSDGALRTSAEIVTSTTCSEIYQNILTLNTTLCAGDRNGYGPGGDGDSGSGLMVKRNNRWMVRGTLSGGLPLEANQYYIYTDVAKVVDWIQSVHSKIKDSDSSNALFPSTKTDDICGEIVSDLNLRPLAFGAFEIERGVWPWLVAIFKHRNNLPTFQCGGTLISNKFILSAAHCFFDRYGALNKDNIMVYLGIHELNNRNSSGVISPTIKNIRIHRDFNTGREISDADIAIITLNEPISFTEYIRPACIWIASETPSDQIGYVVGWGRYETAEISEKPRQVFARIVDGEECLRSNGAFQQITSRRNFCAGNKDLTGPCKGDSGSGLLVEDNGRWFVRGIVSTSLSHPLSNICDLREYVVYSDVSKYTDWIRNITGN